MNDPVGSMLYARSVEESTYNLMRLTRERQFKDTAELNAYMRGLMAGGRMPSPPPKDKAEEAQLLMYKAFAQKTRRKRVAMAREALALCPDCADAYVVLGAESMKTAKEAVALFRQGVEAGRRSLGEAVLQENAGQLWGHVEARPLLRAMDGLAAALWDAAQIQDSLQTYAEILKLNRSDNQGVRYNLLPMLLRVGRIREALELAEDHVLLDDAGATWRYGRALARFAAEGASPASARLLKEAMDRYPLVPGLILGTGTLPEGKMTAGQITDLAQSEQAAESLTKAWREVNGAIQWLRKGGLVPAPVRRTQAKVGRNAPCPCGSGKKYKHCCGGAV